MTLKTPIYGFLVASVFCVFTGNQTNSSSVIAEVNDKKISLESFDLRFRRASKLFPFKPPTRSAFLDDLITRELIIQKAESEGLQKDPLVEEQLEQVLFAAWVEKEMAKKFRPDSISEAEAKAFYSRNPEIRTSHIFIGVSPFASPEEEKAALAKIRDLLKKYDFPGDETPIIRGSALKALENPSDEAAAKPILDLLAKLDEYIPQPQRDLDKDFLMPIEDVFSIEGRGTVVTGRIERGVVKVGEEVEIVGMSEETTKTTVTGVEMFNKSLSRGEAGDNAGILLRGVKKEDVQRGQVLAKPGTITPHTEFEAEMYALTKEEGGRHKPFFKGYKPQFYIRTTDVTGEVVLPEGTEMVMPGDTVNVVIKLIVPVAMQDKVRFAIREGGRTVGAGVVTKIIK